MSDEFAPDVDDEEWGASSADVSQLGALLEGATSDEVDIDFSAAVSYEPLNGEFPVVVTAVETGTSGEGNPKIVFKFDVTDGIDGNGKSAVGRKLRKDCPTTGEGAGITKSVLRALGYEVDDEHVRIRMSKVVGLEAIAVCATSKLNPEFTDIKRLKPYVEGDDLGL